MSEELEQAVRRAGRATGGDVAAMIVAGIKVVASAVAAGVEQFADATKGPEQPTVTVMVSPELIEQLTDWSEPVQIRITKIPYRPSAATYGMEVRPVPDKSNYGATPEECWDPAAHAGKHQPDPCTIRPNSACAGEASGICSGGPAHHPYCSSAQAAPRMAMKGPARKLIGPPHAHLDAPCTDACYEPEQ